MIRWSYVLPRLAVLLIAPALLHFSIPLLARWVLVTSLEATTGTDVDVANVWTSLMRGEMRIGGVQVSRPAGATNVLQFDSANVTLDLNALAHRKCVIDEAQIHGLKFNTPRTTTSSPAPSHRITIPESAVSELARAGQQHTRQWLQHAGALLEQRVEDQFESIRLARQLAQRWPEDYRQLREQAEQLRGSAEQLVRAFQDLSSGGSALDRITELQRRWPEVLQLREQIAALRDRAAQLALQVQQDREKIDFTLQHDYANVRETMRLTQLDGKQLSDFLLDEEVRGWWTQLQPWLESAGWLTDAPELNALGARGREIKYDTMADQENFLIRAADVDGQLVLAGHQVDFVGQARNLTLPGRFGAAQQDLPAQLKLITHGPFTAQLFTQLDTIDGALRHQLAMRCDDLPIPGRSWGDPESLVVSVAPTTARLQARLVTVNGRIDGRLRITQDGIVLAVTAPSRRVPGALRTPLSTAAGSIHQIDVWVDIAGTLDAPRWHLASDLGPQLEAQLQRVAEQVVREQAERLVAEAVERLESDGVQWQRWCSEQEAALRQQLGVSTQLLSQLAEPVASRIEPLQQLLRRY